MKCLTQAATYDAMFEKTADSHAVRPLTAE
jgi:hypothetical protein